MTEVNNEQITQLPTKYKLAICELFNPYFHGFDNNSDPTICSQFLIFETIDINSFYNNDYIISIEFLKNIYQDLIYQQSNITLENRSIENSNTQLASSLQHPIIRNYINILSNKKYYCLDIVKEDTLQGEEMVAYKKTFWLRIFQKKWKNNYYRNIKFYKNPKNLFLREIGVKCN